MKGLLVKDFRLLLQQKMVLIVLVVIAFLLNMNGSGSFAMGYLSFVGTFLVLNTISYDEYDNGYAFLFTLPIERKTYAIEKYVFGIIVALTSWLIGTGISVLQSLTGDGMPMEEILKTCPIYIPICMLFLAIMIPFPLIFGRDKGMIVMYVVLGIVVLAGYFGEKFMESRGVRIAELLDTFEPASFAMLEAGVFAGGIVLLLISCAVSVVGMKKKEF